MLSQETLKEWAIKWQTTEQNALREYCQHLLLASLYPLPRSDKMAFKGGTALRLVFGSPRFSEDLDFTANTSVYHLRSLLNDMVREAGQGGLSLVTRESKSTSGGYLAYYEIFAYGQKMTVSCNVSLREKAATEPILVTNPFTPPYQCLILRREDLVAEKIQALLTRKKPRDFFDLYFLLRERIGLGVILRVKERLLKELKGLDPKTVHRELKLFLPASYQRLAADLPQALLRELERL